MSERRTQVAQMKKSWGDADRRQPMEANTNGACREGVDWGEPSTKCKEWRGVCCHKNTWFLFLAPFLRMFSLKIMFKEGKMCAK